MDSIFEEAASTYDISVDLIKAVAKAESILSVPLRYKLSKTVLKLLLTFSEGLFLLYWAFTSSKVPIDDTNAIISFLFLVFLLNFKMPPNRQPSKLPVASPVFYHTTFRRKCLILL